MKPRFIAIGASILALVGLVAALLTQRTTVPAAPLPIRVPGIETTIQVAPGAPIPGPVIEVLPPLPVIDPPPFEVPAEKPAEAKPEAKPATAREAKPEAKPMAAPAPIPRPAPAPIPPKKAIQKPKPQTPACQPAPECQPSDCEPQCWGWRWRCR